LYNPWGSNQPGQLTWSQLQATCSQMAVASTSGTVAISMTLLKSSSVQAALSAEVFGIAADVEHAESTASHSEADVTPAATSDPPRRDAVVENSQPHASAASGRPAPSHQARSARPAHGVLSAPLVDAMFAAGDFQAQQAA
jgi:hypothetical protein